MQAMKLRRSVLIGALVLGFSGTILVGACDAPIDSACPTPAVDPPVEEPAADCSMPAAKPCMLYRIQLMGNPKDDPVLRAWYIKKFGSACYMSEADTFDCFYKDPQKACADGVLVPEVFGAAAHSKDYPECKKVPNSEDYWRQVGPDPSIKIDITFAIAPRETPLIDVNGMPTAINGPYRDVPEPPTVKVGGEFKCASGMFDADGLSIPQRKWILEVNRKAHGGEIHSDLAGFTYPCDDDCGKRTICTEPLVLTVAKGDPNAAQVHHEVRLTDKRGCAWGTNSNRNAVVISGRLNRHLSNSYPSATEVLRVNNVPPYTP